VSEDIIKLWSQVKKGDHAAWIELVNRYSGLIFAVARRIGLSNLDVEDCAQYTWTALFRNRHKIKDPVSLPAWLILTTKRQAVKVLKRQQRLDECPAHFDGCEGGIPPDEELLKLELQDVIEHAIGQLGPKCRKLIYALFLSSEKKSYKDIARELDISPNNMGSSRSRCLKKLAEILKKMGYPEH